jgi:hypothetical protein
MRGILLTLALVLATPACAQTSSGGGQAAAELNRLHSALHLTPAQEPAWRTYTAAISASADGEDRRRAAEKMLPTLTTPRRVALMESMMAADEADLRRQGRAVTALYDVLNPAQRQTFDHETLPPAGG